MDHGDQCYFERKCHSGGTELWYRRALPTSVGTVMVLGTDKPQSQVRERWSKSSEIQDTVSSAIELTCNIAFDGAHTPKACFLRAGVNFLAPRTRQRLEF